MRISKSNLGIVASGVTAAVTHASIAQHVGITETTNSTAITSSAITTTAGNAMVMVITTRGGSGTPAVSSVTDQASNTWASVCTPAVTTTAARIEVWATTAATPTHLAAQTVTVTMNQSGVSKVLEFFEIAGAPNNTSLIDQYSLATSGTGTTLSSGATAALSGTGELALGIIASHGGASLGFTGFTQGAVATSYGTSTSTDVEACTIAAGTLTITSTNAQTFTGTISFSTSWAAGVIVFK